MPSRPAQAVRIVSAQLRYWRLPHLVEAAAARTGELLADVRRHAGEDRHCTVEVVLLWDRLSVAACGGTVSPLPAQGGGPRRGPTPVPAVRDSRGVRRLQDERGRVSWYTLPVPFPPAPPEAGHVGCPWAAHA